MRILGVMEINGETGSLERERRRGLEQGRRKQAGAVYCSVLVAVLQLSSNYESHISLIILTYTRITDTQRHSVLRSSLRWQLITAPAKWNFK